MSQGEQKSSQVYELRRYFRKTSMGGMDETHVFTVRDGNIVEVMPKYSFRSRSGRHGEDVWYLTDGKYVVADISRSNNVRNPLTVTVWCYDINNGMATRRELATFYENTVEDALMYARKLTYQCIPTD